MQPENENPNAPHSASAKQTKEQRAEAAHERRARLWDTAPARVLIAQFLRNPTPDTVAFICADRVPKKWRALTLAAAALHAHSEAACNGEWPDESAEQIESEGLHARAEAAACDLFGPNAVCFYQGDPRGLPLFIKWPGMPRRLRCAWNPERGMPVLFRSLNFADALDALAPDWNAENETF